MARSLSLPPSLPPWERGWDESSHPLKCVIAGEVHPLGEYTIHHDIHVTYRSYGYFA